MKITFLGTGTSQGVPLIGCDCKVCTSTNKKDKRLRTAIKIEVNNSVFVVDTGPDFRQQMLRSGTKQLDAVIFTHHHKDHTAGFDDVRSFNRLMNKPIEVYAEHYVQESLKYAFPYVFEDLPYPGILKINMHTITEEAFTINDTRIIPVRLMHHQLPVLGFRIGNFAYLTDLKTIPEKEFSKLENLDVLVIAALQKNMHISHANLDEALAYIDIIKPKQAYLTHMNHTFGLHDEEDNLLPDKVFLAYDELELEL